MGTCRVFVVENPVEYLGCTHPPSPVSVNGTVLTMIDPAGSLDPLTSFETIASLRRSSLRVDPDKAIPDELVDRLITISATVSLRIGPPALQ